MKDIIINGISVNEMKNQKDLIREGAAKIIADGIAKVKTIVSSIVETFEDSTTHEIFAKDALETLQIVELVSDVSGVEYYMEYDSNYDTNEDAISNKLEEVLRNMSSYQDAEKSIIRQLAALAESMESTCAAWNNSNC